MRVYKVTLENTAVTAAITLIQIKAGANTPFCILRAWLGQSNITASGQQRIQILRKSAAATVTSYTPLLLDSHDAAAQAVGGASATGINASAEGTDGDNLYVDTFNLLTGWLYIPTPEERIWVPAAGIIGIKLPAAPGASTTINCGITFGEVG